MDDEALAAFETEMAAVPMDDPNVWDTPQRIRTVDLLLSEHYGYLGLNESVQHLLADLRHFCDRVNVDFGDAVTHSDIHFIRERMATFSADKA